MTMGYSASAGAHVELVSVAAVPAPSLSKQSTCAAFCTPCSFVHDVVLPLMRQKVIQADELIARGPHASASTMTLFLTLFLEIATIRPFPSSA